MVLGVRKKSLKSDLSLKILIPDVLGNVHIPIRVKHPSQAITSEVCNDHTGHTHGKYRFPLNSRMTNGYP